MKEKEVKPVVHSEADLIWKEIQDLPIDMFALPGQKVSQYVKKLEVPGDQLLVKITASSVLPSLESALASVKARRYVVELAEGYVIIKRAPAKLV